jgi:dynein heavy chain 2
LITGDALALGDLFHPGIFINALRQQTARELGLAIDCVKMVTCWDKDTRQLKRDCPLPCLLSGMLLQGASFHSNVLHDAAPDASELTPLQSIAIGFVNQDVDTFNREDALAIPVYLSPSREDYLMDLQVPAGDKCNHDRWILSGVAIFLVEGD